MKYRDRDWLYEKYHIEDKLQEEIADDENVSISTISYWMNKNNINTKQYERLRKDPQNIEKIKEKYESGSSLADISNEVTVSVPTVSRWMTEAGVKIRDPSPTGENNVLWNGGYEPDDDAQRFYSSSSWQRKRKEILKRDNQKCTQCGSVNNLDVHHMRPIKMGGSKLNNYNLMTVCRRCHNYLHNKIYFG